MGFFAFLIVLWVILMFLQPIGFILTAAVSFIKDHWYLFFLLAWFFRN